MIYWEKKKRLIGRRRARKRESDEMPLGNPSVSSRLSAPLLSCPFNLPLRLILSSSSSPHLILPFSNANFLHSAIPDTWLRLRLLSLVVCLSSLPLSPSRTVRAGMELFNERSSAASTCSSIISLQFLHVVSVFTTTQHCVEQHSQAPGTMKYAWPDICMYMNTFKRPPPACKGLVQLNCKIHIL